MASGAQVVWIPRPFWTGAGLLRCSLARLSGKNPIQATGPSLASATPASQHPSHMVGLLADNLAMCDPHLTATAGQDGVEQQGDRKSNPWESCGLILATCGWAGYSKIRKGHSCLKKGAGRKLLCYNIWGIMWLDQGLCHCQWGWGVTCSR